MMLTTSAFALTAIIAAIADRAILKRTKITMVDVGEITYREAGKICFPMDFHNRSPYIKGANVEYWLRNKENPSLVINGYHRTLDMCHIGLNSEYLSFKKTTVSPGNYELVVRITHGDCRWNPFYRIFPITSVLRKNVTIREVKTNARLSRP